MTSESSIEDNFISTFITSCLTVKVPLLDCPSTTSTRYNEFKKQPEELFIKTFCKHGFHCRSSTSRFYQEYKEASSRKYDAASSTSDCQLCRLRAHLFVFSHVFYSLYWCTLLSSLEQVFHVLLLSSKMSPYATNSFTHFCDKDLRQSSFVDLSSSSSVLLTNAITLQPSTVNDITNSSSSPPTSALDFTSPFISTRTTNRFFQSVDESNHHHDRPGYLRGSVVARPVWRRGSQRISKAFTGRLHVLCRVEPLR